MRPRRRLEDRIRELSTRVTHAEEQDLERLIGELQVALSEYTRRAGNKTSATVLQFPDAPKERRNKPSLYLRGAEE